MKNKDITGRIKELMDYKGLNSHSLSQKLGYKSSEKISRLFRASDAKPSYDIIYDIANLFEINIDWLITGRGKMLKEEGQKSPDDVEDDRPVAVHTDNPREGIPLIPLDAMAGALTGEQNVLEYECERYVVPAFKGADFLIPVKGLSMYPHYNSGDIVACQRVPLGDLFFQWNKVYVIDTRQGTLIKRIKPGSDKLHILIVSDNKDYDPFELPYTAINAVALVIGVIRLE